tara:strand:+ start:132675 stop:133406 length:732 start_codon:yes stop_codon:yes gene_type:complete
MSFKDQLFTIILVGFVCFGSCEDKKKPSEEKIEISTENKKDSVAVNTLEDKTEPVKKEFPKITNENVVAFLTQYGNDNPETKVKISTQFGEIDIELTKDTPLHRANFIYLVKQGYFDKTFFHRAVPNFIIQGGNSDLTSTPEKRSKIGKDYLIPAEIIPGRVHKYGTVSGAKEYRENPDKNSAPFEFFIFLGPLSSTSHLNGSYTVFGNVTKGMDVVEKIAKLPTDDGEWPLQNIYITAKVLK